MRFAEIMRDRRGFIHKRLIGAATGFLGGGGVVGAVGGFLGGGGTKVVPGTVPTAPTGPRPSFGPFGRRRQAAPPAFIPIPGGVQLIPSSAAPPGPLGIPLLPCIFPFVRQADGSCKFDLDPGGGTGIPGGPQGDFPAGPEGGPTNMVQPQAVCIETLVCPTFADNKKGVLWMQAMTGVVVCLPRGVNGSGFGLIRKNRPRRKAFVTAAEISALRGQARTKKKAKKFAALTGQVCVTRGSRARSSR